MVSPFAAGQKGASDTKRAWDAARRAASQPMGPSQSMAMAGNTGLAGFSENQANEIKKAQQAIQDYNQSQGGGSNEPPVSFKDIGQEIGELGSKYRRPVGFDQYANKAMLFNQGIAGGGKIIVGPDGIPRLQFGDQVVRDPNTGKQMLSMMLPQLTASAPTLGQLGGDIVRAFTGYDSLKYPDQNFQGPFPLSKSKNFNARDLPYMSRTPGMFEGVDPLSFIPFVGTAMKIGEGIKGVYDFMFPKDPVVTTGGSSNITVSEEPTQTVPQFPYNFETKIKPKPDPSFKKIDSFNPNAYQPGYLPEGFNNVGIENPLFRNIKYEPIRVSDMDMSNVVAQNEGLSSLVNLYNLAKNPQVETKYGTFTLDDILNNPTLGYQTDVFGGQLGLTAQPNEVGFTFQKAFNKGGSVNKHSGLGYMLK